MTFDKGVYVSGERWRELRVEPPFIELIRLARVANSLALAYAPLLAPLEDQSPAARRDRFAAMVYAGALLHEGLHTAQGLGKHFRDLPQYREGFARLLGDKSVNEFRSRVLDRLRDELVFHSDRESIARGLAEFAEAETLILSASEFQEGSIYFDIADEAVLGCLFGSATTEADYLRSISEFLEQTTDLFQRFMRAAHSLIPAALRKMGAYSKPMARPPAPDDDAG
jgi:hypothetical protein